MRIILLLFFACSSLSEPGDYDELPHGQQQVLHQYYHPVQPVALLTLAESPEAHESVQESPSSPSIPQLYPHPSSTNFTSFSNLSDSFLGQAPTSLFSLSTALPTQPPSPYQQVLQFQTIQYSSGRNRKRSLAVHRRDNGPAQSWPGTDTVYATKTVYISQALPATTVFVSNGQVVTSFPPPNSSPTPYAVYPNNNNNGAWVSPNGNPNVVVATVTAMSSAHRISWETYYSTHAVWWTMMAVINLLICIFTFIGFGFVSFGL
ncbi:hypothetical protein PCASD_22576 [Puccinia coronata f. sp. avenae]|uniref:Transmembrane protein n=1 Tax=Puccinia coronata f. sp. avenae TaxID=200324 RepID=A0A2N5SA20_9BASI|nr:hypothetical protein PCASD_22576 [Puccinia coronata f. sp. avenae]